MTMTKRASAVRLRAALGAVALAGAAAFLAGRTGGQQPHFYPDDPIAREPESQDASKAAPYSRPDTYEMIENLFVTPKYQPSGLRALNVNTIDEVPDSSWFTNRIGTTAITPEQLARGPIVDPPPDPSAWVLTREKSGGAHPGFTARDARGDTFFIEFDDTDYPEGQTSAVSIATKLFWALGYYQVESYVSTFDPKRVTIDPKATVRRPSGKRTPFTHDDINAILEKVSKRPDGTYRIIAGRLLPGKVLGEFRYAGTRPDDPNDLVPHEHRRELRALAVFGAWTNLTDLKAANTLDSLITENGKTRVRHYLQDVGSTFGMPNMKHEWDLSWEHFYEGGPTWKRFWSLGFALSPWQTVNYEQEKAIGKYEADVWDPRKWKPQTATKAWKELRDDDAFWAARKVAAFSDELIRAAVHAGEFSNQAAEKHLGDVIIARRDKIKRIYLTAVNPIVNPRLDGNNLTFENAAVAAGVASGPVAYRASWARFDNATGATQPIGEAQGNTTTLPAPSSLPTADGSYVEVNIAAEAKDYPAWKRPVKIHFRREGSGWKLVGLERLPAGPVKDARAAKAKESE
jgi:hypothetical protein